MTARRWLHALFLLSWVALLGVFSDYLFFSGIDISRITASSYVKESRP